MKKEPIEVAALTGPGLAALVTQKDVLLRLELSPGSPGYKTGTIVDIARPERDECTIKVDYDDGSSAKLQMRVRTLGGTTQWYTKSYSRMIVAWRTVMAETLPPEPAPKEEFSDKGIMPSDHPGINEMLKKGFKEIFGGEMQPAPAKRTLPSNKALFIVASEKYLGLGFNDEQRL